MKQEELRVELNPEFVRSLFKKLLNMFGDKYGTISKVTKITGISRCRLYFYRLGKIRTIPLSNFRKIVSILKLDRRIVNQNIIQFVTGSEIRKEALDKGRFCRKIELQKFRRNIPALNQLLKEEHLNLEKWFFSYKKLIDFGARQFKRIDSEGNKLVLEYGCYSKGINRTFVNIVPRKIKIDDEFLYFFGLWVGDKAGGGRFGVINKNKEILLFTKRFLEKNFQNVESVLYYHRNVPADLDIHIDKAVKIKSGRNGYAISMHSINSIFKRFFDMLEKNLDEFISCIPNKYAFFAGLFDAEGNVFLEDRCVRWSCKNPRNVRIFASHLKKLDLFKRYDGSNLVCYNVKKFGKYILPYLKHPQKINDLDLILNKRGSLNKRFLTVLEAVDGAPGISTQDLSKALKKVKVYSQIRFLEGLNLVRKEDYPKMLYITKNGSEALLRGGKDI